MRAELYDVSQHDHVGRDINLPESSKAEQRYWAELDLDSLVHNFQVTQSLVPDYRLICVLKDDSYGQGSVQVAKELEKAGATYFAVATAEEALQLRRDGVGETPVLVLGMVGPKWVRPLAASDITVVIGDISAAWEYSELLDEGQRLKVHIAIDTGMNRIGLKPEEAVVQIQEITTIENLEVEGIFTHFTSAEDDDEIAWTLHQIDLFNGVIDGLDEVGIHIPIQHYSNSAAISCFTEQMYSRTTARINAARPGIILYGVNPYPPRELDLRPILALRARIMKIKTIKKGETVSYNRTWTAQRDSVIATIGVGYGDGYLRSLSNKAEVLIKGQRAPQVGKICMDQCMLDITDIENVAVGDHVTILGADGGDVITYEELAEKGGIIAAEIMHAVGKRISRVYYEEEELFDQVCYIDYL